MDRVSRTLALSGLGLLLTAAGCRSTRSEVPPGRPYSNDGRQRPAIGFSNDPHPVDGAAITNIMPDSPGAARTGQGVGVGTNRPDALSALGGGLGSNGNLANIGAPTANGDPNAAGSARGGLPADDSVVPAGAPSLPRPSINPTPAPSSGRATLPADAEPLPDLAAPASQAVQPVLDSPGKMGQANDLPNPN